MRRAGDVLRLPQLRNMATAEMYLPLHEIIKKEKNASLTYNSWSKAEAEYTFKKLWQSIFLFCARILELNLIKVSLDCSCVWIKR